MTKSKTPQDPQDSSQKPARKTAQGAVQNSGQADPLADFRGDLRAAETKYAKMLDYKIQLPGMSLGLMLVLLSVFLPHATHVLGLDVLFNSSTAIEYGITIPERIYTVLAVVGGVLLTIGTIVSKSWLVAWTNWAFVGIGWWYSIIAIWMRQSRPPSDIAGPPSYGLIVGCVGMTLLFIMLTWVLFRRNPLQKALAAARRAEAQNQVDEQVHQQVLRTGLVPEPEAKLEDVVDDRRQRAKLRRQRRSQNQSRQESQVSQESQEGQESHGEA